MSMRSLDEVDGFDDFESEVSSSEETMAVQRTHSQSQQKNIKSGKFGGTLGNLHADLDTR